MALTVDVLNHTVFGNKRVTVADVDFDSSYPTDGEPLTAKNLRLDKVELLLASPNRGLSFEYDYTNSKLKAFVQGFDTGVAGAVVVDDFPITSGVGTTAGSVSQSAASLRFGGLKEIANTTDMSTITDVRVIAIGF